MIFLFKALLFSATFQKRIEFLARSVTSDPIRINVGTTGQANEDITQIVQVFDDETMKWDWIIRRLVGFCVGKLISLYTCVIIILNYMYRGKRDYICWKKRCSRFIII